ncbi:MAG: sodium-dependent transporter [Alphaproteobacteria bacterium]|nr:MAG: sodium-dependent transporter [Alphaproteobacteria bacterium]
MAAGMAAGSSSVGDGGHRFSSRFGFVLAAVGAAVGLGNVWKFPYLAGENGGALFVLLYLIFLLAIAMPILIAEVLIGRRGHVSPPHALKRQASEFTRRSGTGWYAIGVAGVVFGLVIMSFYSVVSGWIFDYMWTGITQGFGAFDPGRSRAHLAAMQASVPRLLVLQGLFIVLTVAIVALGVRRGIEAAMRWMMPAMGLLMIGLVVYALVAGAGSRALVYLFAPDWTRLTVPVAAAALGQAFFTLSVGLGGMMTYGAYLPDRASIVRSCTTVALADTAVALLAGLAIFPIVFAEGLDPAGGPGLIFVTLPIAFADMPGGDVFGVAFFAFLFLAAITSAIALYEPTVAWLEERGIRRLHGTLIAAGGSWLMGLVTVLSFNEWNNVHPLAWAGERFAGATPFETITLGLDNLILPVGALLIAWFAGRLMPAPAVVGELSADPPWVARLFRLAVRWWAPLGILALLVFNFAGMTIG